MPPRITARLVAPLALAALAPLLLAGCGSSSQAAVLVTVTAAPSVAASMPTASTAASSAMPTARPAAPSTLQATIPASSKPTCGTDAARVASAKASATLPVDKDMQEPWSPSNVDDSHYDACSPLSWIVLGTGGASRFVPRSIALFHYGRLIKAAGPTDPLPEVKRLDDDSIQITWTSPRDASETSWDDYSLKSTSVYSWDDDSGTITRTGALPPAASTSGAAPTSTTTGGGARPAPAGATQASRLVGSGNAVAIILTPTGNIGCDLTATVMGCGIKSLQTSSPYPDDEFGRSWFVSFASDGTTTIGGLADAPLYMTPNIKPQALAYGTSIQHGMWACTSEARGLTCWNTRTGHGAFMDRNGYKPF